MKGEVAIDEQDYRVAYAEQARALIDGGCDLLFLETVTCRRTLEACLAGVDADRDGAGESRPMRFVRYQLATGALALAGNTAITAALVALTRLPVVAANVVAVAVLSLASFVVGDRWIFQTRNAERGIRTNGREAE